MNFYYLLGSLLLLLPAQADPFINLGFDEANTSKLEQVFGPPQPVLKGVGLVSDLLPGWQLYHGSEAVSQINFNALPPSSDVISLDDDGTGGYRLDFSNALNPFSLFQRGDIPEGATAIQFETGGGLIGVSIDGQSLTSFGPGGLDVSPWAGKNVLLGLTTIEGCCGLESQFLDDIRFVPEPPPMLLLTFAGLMFVFGFKRIAERKDFTERPDHGSVPIGAPSARRR